MYCIAGCKQEQTRILSLDDRKTIGEERQLMFIVNMLRNLVANMTKENIRIIIVLQNRDLQLASKYLKCYICKGNFSIFLPG